MGGIYGEPWGFGGIQAWDSVTWCDMANPLPLEWKNRRQKPGVWASLFILWSHVTVGVLYLILGGRDECSLLGLSPSSGRGEAHGEAVGQDFQARGSDHFHQPEKHRLKRWGTSCSKPWNGTARMCIPVSTWFNSAHYTAHIYIYDIYIYDIYDIYNYRYSYIYILYYI